MPKYKIEFQLQAIKDIAFHRKSGNLSLYRKIEKILEELELHPRTGTGKPEPLKFGMREFWSRRISGEHRLIYSIKDEIVTVEIISAKSHYGDK